MNIKNNENKPITRRTHWSFWSITGIALIWNVMGCINFFMQMDPDILASYRETERALIENRPFWATVAFAVAVFGGAIGCLLILFRKSFSYYLFVVSFLGVVITIVHTFSTGIGFSMGEILGIILMPVAVALFLIFYSKYTKAKGWIK